jgi:N-methylhydantoinase A
MRLDVDAARRAIDEHIAWPLGLSVDEAAWGVHQVVNENMAAAARVHVLEHGRTPENYSMVAFGGAGPTHAYGVARALNLPEIVIPWHAGVGSAFGMLCAPVSFEMAQSRSVSLDEVNWRDAADLLETLRRECTAQVRRAGVHETELVVQRSADIRYRGQGHEIQIELEGLSWPDVDTNEVRHRFRSQYRHLNGVEGPDHPVDVITWRTSVRGPIPQLPLANPDRGTSPEASVSRPVYFAETGGFVEARVIARGDLKSTTSVAGPAIIDLGDASISVGPAGQAQLRPDGLIAIRLERRES